MPSTMPLMSNSLVAIGGVDKAWAISNLKGDGGIERIQWIIEDLIKSANQQKTKSLVPIAQLPAAPKSTQKPPAITVRSATLADLPAIEAMAEHEDWASGLPTMELYFKTSPDMWYVAVNTETNELIGYWVHNKLNDQVAFAYQVLIKEEYRGQGVIRLFKKMKDMDLPSMGNCTACSLFRMKWEKFQWKLLGGVTTIARDQLPKSPAIADKLSELTEQELPELCAYDKQISLLDRTTFLKSYGLNDGNSNDQSTVRTLISRNVETNQITGFGILRRWSGCYGLSPCYADSDDIALNLMISLASTIDEGEQMYIPFPASCETSMWFANQLKVEFNTAEVRSMSLKAYDIYAEKLDMSKVYAVHEYWPV